MKEFPWVRVSVETVTPVPDAEAPPDRPHAFRYDISIRNEGGEPVVLRGRKWVVSDLRGGKTVVEGDGIVGQMPLIPPGGRFRYHSFHLVDGESRAEGAFYGVTPSGECFFTRIPPFRMCPGLSAE